MSYVIQAVYENGVLKPLERLALGEHQQVQLTVDPDMTAASSDIEQADPLEGVRAATGLPDLAEHYDDYRFGRRKS